MDPEVYTHRDEWRDYMYVLELRKISEPDAEPEAWAVSYWITLADGETEALPKRPVADRPATSYDEARDLGASHARSAIDALADRP